MPTFILRLNCTTQGIRAVKEAPKRSLAAKELAKKLGVGIKQVYLTSGEHDLLIMSNLRVATMSQNLRSRRAPWGTFAPAL